MVAINAQDWLTTKVTDLKNAKQIYGTKDGKYSSDKGNREFLTGDLLIESLNDLEELDLYDVRELNKVTIKNCSKLKKINLLDSGIKQLEVGPGLDRIEELNIGFEINLIDRPTARKLDKIDLSNVTSLKILKCVGIQETELIGFEKLTQLETFRGGDGVKIPNSGKWKAKFDTITNPSNGLDLLDSSGDVDPIKLNGYKTKPDIPITREQWDNDYSTRPTKKELQKIQSLHDLVVRELESKLGNDWKAALKVESAYSQIEQSSK